VNVGTKVEVLPMQGHRALSQAADDRSAASGRRHSSSMY
jgi:hypothetical protein